MEDMAKVDMVKVTGEVTEDIVKVDMVAVVVKVMEVVMVDTVEGKCLISHDSSLGGMNIGACM